MLAARRACPRVGGRFVRDSSLTLRSRRSRGVYGKGNWRAVLDSTDDEDSARGVSRVLILMGGVFSAGRGEGL